MRSVENDGGREGAPTAIDLFSGCGGLTLGLKQAGFRVLAAVEIDAGAAATYRMNHPEVALVQADIRSVAPEELAARLSLGFGELDLLAGCPPCQGFSTLRTKNGARGNRDARNQLIREMLRFVDIFRPRAVMMENVPRLGGHNLFKVLCRRLRLWGYRLRHDVKDAAAYGVPQRRRRLILVASRVGEIELAAESDDRRTVRNTIEGLPPPGATGDVLHDLPERPRAARIRQLIQDIPKDGGGRNDLPISRQLECHRRTDGFADIYGRMAWDDVAPTITSGCFNPSKGRFLHPTHDRAITMREAALLQGFPPEYAFDVSRGKEAVALMIGNALPPEFIRRHASQIREALKRPAINSA